MGSYLKVKKIAIYSGTLVTSSLGTVGSKLTNELNSLSSINQVGINPKQPEFKLNLSMEELKRRTDDDNLLLVKLLDVNSKEYNDLQDGDKKALKHLLKAGDVMNQVNLQLDNHYNFSFIKYLNKEITKGNE